MNISPRSFPQHLVRALSACLFLATLALAGQSHAQLYLGQFSSAPSPSDSVGVYDPTTGATINDSLLSNLLVGHPTSLAIYGNNLFVTNSLGTTAGQSVGEYNLTTGLLENSSFIPVLTRARSLMISGSTLYVGSGTSAIGTYDANTGQPINANFVTSGLNTVEGMVQSGNTLYVASFTGNSVATVDATTGAILNASFITGLSSPTSLAIVGSNLYVVNENNSTIGQYSISTGTGNAAYISTGLNKPWGVAAIGNDIYVTNTTNGVVSEYDVSGASAAVVNADLLTTTGLDKPEAIIAQPVPEPGGAMLFAGTVVAFVSGSRRRKAV